MLNLHFHKLYLSKKLMLFSHSYEKVLLTTNTSRRLTNNDAQPALPPSVTLRTLSLVTPTPVAPPVSALLASVIDTCRQRGHAPWRYLERAIADRRAGLPLAPLPQPLLQGAESA